MKPIEALIANQTVQLHDGLARLNRGGHRVLLLVDADGRLARTVTDGDIRRLILGGATMNELLSSLPELEPRTVPPGTTSEEALRIMIDLRIDHLPVVDDKGYPIALFDRRELDGEILLSTPHLSQYEQDYVEEAFSSNWIAPLGPNVDAFEKELAAYVGVGHAAAVSSGTAALHLALRLLGVEAGDTVFCSSLTFVASANPVLYQGARPTFIDSDPETWNMSLQSLTMAFDEAAKKGQLPKAVIVVNLYGQSADMDAINRICEKYGAGVVEDAAESLGARYKDKASGTLGKLGVYSFNGNKIITTSGGGMLVSDDVELINQARFLSTQARDPAPYYQHTQVGYNYRMSNILAGIGRGQLRVLDERVDSRRGVFERYKEGLKDLPAIRWMPEAAFSRGTRWLSAFVLDQDRTSITPTELISRLAQLRIEARHVWKPMHQQPLFAGCPYYTHAPGQSISDHVFENGVCLPSGSNMSIGQQNRVIDALHDALGR